MTSTDEKRLDAASDVAGSAGGYQQSVVHLMIKRGSKP